MNTTILKTGVNIATSAASANSALPTAQSGEIPRYIRIAASVAAHVRLGTGVGTTALVTDMMVQPGDAVTVVVPRGLTYVAAIQDTAAGTVNIVPLEDC